MSERDILLVGTGHVLEKSVREVEDVIVREKPDIVAVELCAARYQALKGEIREFSPKELLTVGNPFLLLTYWMLAYVQRRIGKELGIEPGADMIAAIKKGEELGCKIALIDRPVQITMQRFWKKMQFVEKLKMILSIIFSIAWLGCGCSCSRTGEETGSEELDRITDDDVVTQLIKELRKFSPGGATALLDERDAYIASNLLELQAQSMAENATQTSFGEKRRIVAVVGAGHVAGIKKFLDHQELIPPMEELCALSTKRSGSV